MNSYHFIIACSLIIILSALYSQIAKKTNIPSVMLLIITGILIKQGIDYFQFKTIDFFPVLEVLGIVGLIMIVLEASLELELKKEKWPIIWKSMAIALISLIATSFFCAFALHYLIDGMDQSTALLYATPLSILSSAIIIPSVKNLDTEKREFHTYESTFSDIFGIIMFYMILGQLETPKSFATASINFIGQISITIVISFIAGYVLIFLFHQMKTQVKLLLLIAILLLLYAIGKSLHLSSLIIILVFGMILANTKVFFRGALSKKINVDSLNEIKDDFHVVTAEGAFMVRTFFFVVFGMSVALSSLVDMKVITTSIILLVSIYLIRLLWLRVFIGKNILPQLYIAPRGLITILLFFSIPSHLQYQEFRPGILLFLIIASSIIMTIALIKFSKKPIEEMNEISDDLESETLSDE